MTEENLKLGQCPFFETGVSIHRWISRVFRHVPEKSCADTGTSTQRPGVQAPEPVQTPVQKTLEGVADFCNNAGHAGKRLNPGK